MSLDLEKSLAYLQKYFKPHPWHGIPVRSGPEYLNVFIEIVPTDTIKYELDKDSGYLCIDRPQKYSNYVPALYGFVPRTYCSEQVAKYAADKTGEPGLLGDGDPLDICVLSEKPITHGDLLLQARPIGGFRMLDAGEVDDKIIAVLKDDAIYGDMKDLNDCPSKVISRLKHYFLTYKDLPGEGARSTRIEACYGRAEAEEVIRLATADYLHHFPPFTKG